MGHEPVRASRRHLLALTAALGVGAVGGCSTAPTSTTGGGPPSVPAATTGTASNKPSGKGHDGIVWWDQFNPLADLEKKTFADFHAGGGPAVDYTVYNPNDQGKALQLAFSSNQMPDVFSLAGVNISPQALHEQGWFAPIPETSRTTIQQAFPDGVLIDGLHIFDDKLYSFPMFSFREYVDLGWFNSSLLKKADLDPSSPPKSWDDFRKACKTLKSKNIYGVVLPLKFANRMEQIVSELAEVAGFPGGINGIDLSTGEYKYHDDAYVQAIEFLKSFKDDKTMFPASTSLDARTGRARWVTGAAAWFFDGSWNPGVIAGSFKSFMKSLGVGPIPTPEGNTPVLTRAPKGGTFWISAQSQQVDAIGQLLTRFVQKKYYEGMANQMDQPPFDESVVADSDADPTYKTAINFFKDQVFLGPTPSSRPGVTAVESVMKPVSPTLGAIIQGVFSGQVKDVKKTLKKLSDDTSKAREAAIKSKGGGKVSADDWAFPDWKKGTDYAGH